MTSPILARADALMHRRRPGSQEPDDIPVLTDAVVAASEIPLLLDEAPDQPPATEPTAAAPEIAADADTVPDDTLFDELAGELVKRVHARLAAELPTIVDDSLRELLADPDIVARLRRRD